MEVAALSLNYLLRPPNTKAPAPPLLILLHGIGSNEQDLFALAPYIDERFLIVSARAPITLMPGSYAWFHVDYVGSAPHINAEEAEDSRQSILKFIDETVDAYQADRGRVYLMGFSQGAIMSMSIMLTRPGILAGIVAMSGRILPDAKAKAVDPHQLEGFPVMLVHGLYDQVLTISNGRASRDYLSTFPVTLTYHEYPMAHQINDQSLGDVQAWLSSQLDNGKRRGNE